MFIASFAAMMFLAINSFANDPKAPEKSYIPEMEVVEVQRAWGDGIVKIGEVYTSKGDYEKAAMDHIQEFYGYDMGKVLFKPTLASDKQFRGTFDAALSYFVGDNKTYAEDKGFAIKPWTNVRWENEGIINNPQSNMAVAMGNYYFTTVQGDEVKVEYTFVYVRDYDGKLKIVAHKSAMPFSN
jgi:hypothetical protein